MKIPFLGVGKLTDNVGVNLGLDWPPLAGGFHFSHYTHTHQATTSSYPKDNGLDIIILIIMVDNSSFPCNIFKRRIGHLARINWGEWSWKGICKRQLDRQTTQWISFDTRRDIKYNKVFNICGHTYLTCRLYYQWIISNIQRSFFLILFFLPSLNWEREYVIAILRKSGGRKQS